MRLTKMIKASLFGLAFFVAGCGGAPTKPAVDEDQAVLQTLGRYVWTEDDRQKAGWPGSGTEFAFTGTRATISITDDGDGIMDLRVNGQSSQIDLDPGTQDYTLVETDTPQNFRVRLTRRTEFYDTGYYELGVPELDGAFTAFAPTDRQILFLGDSITAGFGVAGDTRDCANTPAMHAPTQSYAMLAADGLNAEPQLIAISGRGVVHNWDGNPAPVMPAQIDFALPDASETIWDHAQFTPDVVVTLLGTNDWSVIDPGRDKFRAGYRDMLSDLRQRFPAAHIVTVSGPLLGGEQGAAIRDGIDWAMAELDDPQISTLDMSLSEFGYKWSCNSHPGRTSMKWMANDLMAHIQAQIGWDYMPIAMPPVLIPPADYPEGGKAHFARRVAEIAAEPVMDGGTLLIGDSITEGWGWNPEHRALLPDDIANHGVGWDRADGVLARLPQILPNRAERIFIKIGTNDISQGRTTEAIVADVETLLAALRNANPNAEIFVQSILPREADKLLQIAEVNSRYRDVADEYGADYIDLTPHFAAADGTLKPELTTDALHLNLEGYRVWARILSTYLPE